MKLSKQKMTQQVTKPNSWKIVTITLLAIVVVTGAIIGILWMGQGKQSESEYTWVKIFGDSEAYAKLGGYEYTFLYKSHYYYDPEKPIEIREEGRSWTQAIPSTAGKTYDVLGSIQVVVSEVNDDYIILLVKAL
jgi:hypothetical protein